MSKGAPHFSQQWLDDYRKRLDMAQKPHQKPATARLEHAHALVPYSPAESVAVPLRAAGGKQTKTEEK